MIAATALSAGASIATRDRDCYVRFATYGVSLEPLC
jgi:predicted nucleic acid-binding protein